MAVVANISVLLSARIEGYRSQIGFARQDNETFARSATQAGLKIRDAGKAMDILRQRSFEQLSTQQKLNEEMRAINHLFKAGIIDQGNYAKAMIQLNDAYRQKAALEAAKAQDSLNNSIQRGTEVMRPQLAAQKEALADYKRTAQALRDLEQSGTAKKLGITSDEIENRRREAFLTGQAKFQGKETPAQIQERTAKATEAATAAVSKFNEKFQTAKQRLSATLDQLRLLREQAVLAGTPLNLEAQSALVQEAKETFRKDSGLTDRIRREQKAREENNQAIQRGIQLLDQNFAARQRLGNQLRDLQAAAKSDPDRFGGQKLEEARKKAFQEYRNETQSSTQLAAASVDKFNQKFVTAKQRLRDTINELRVMRQTAADAGKVLSANAQNQFVQKAVETFREDSGTNARLRDQAKARDEANKAAERGIELVDKDFVANERRRKQLLQQLADIDAAQKVYRNQGLGVQKFATARVGIFEELAALQQGRESPAAIAERQAQELAVRKAAIEKENIAAIKATMTAEQTRAAEYAKINQDIVDGLSAEAAARRRLAVDSEFNKRTGVDQRLQIEADLVQKYNASIARGTQIARPAKAATDEYRQTIKDLGRALNAARISQQEYNVARLQATRLRRDASISPILQSGINQVAPYRQVIQTVVRSIQDMRVAVNSGKVTQAEYTSALVNGIRPAEQLLEVQKRLESAYRRNKISLAEYVAGLRAAKSEIIGKTSLLQRLTSSLGVFRTVAIGMAGAQVYSSIFTGISDAFTFEPKIRRAIALFGELEEAQKASLRRVTFSETFNNVPILDRVQVLEELAKDGVDAEVAIRSLGKTLAFASVSGLNAQDSVSRVSEVMKAYRQETGNAQEDTLILSQIMDLLVTSANQTASDVAQVAEALIRTAPQANQLGISMREAAKGVISLSEIGRKGEVGGNELAIALRDLANKAIENKEAFKDLGVTFFETDGYFVGMETSIQQLADALRELTPEQRTMALQSIGVTQKASQFQQQLISLVDVLKDSKTAFEDTNGAVERLHKESMTELVFLANQVRTAFAYIVNSTIVAWFEKLAGWINNTSAQTRQMIAATVTFVAVLVSIKSAVASISVVIAALKVYRATLIATLAVKYAMVALAGPKGWLLIASSIGVAAAAAGAMYYGIGLLEEQLASTSAGMQNFNDSVDRLRTSIGSGRQDLVDLRAAMSDVFTNLDNRFKAEGIDSLSESISGIQAKIANANVAEIQAAQQSIEQLQTMVSGFFDQARENISAEATARYFADLNAQIRNVSRAMDSVDVAKLKALREELDNITKGVQTPLEKAVEDIRKLTEIKKANLFITPVIERRRINQVLDELIGDVQQKVSQQTIKLNSAAEIRGSQREFSSRVTVTSSDSVARDQRDYYARSLRLAKDGNRSLGEIASLLEDFLRSQATQESSNILDD